MRPSLAHKTGVQYTRFTSSQRETAGPGLTPHDPLSTPTQVETWLRLVLLAGGGVLALSAGLSLYHHVRFAEAFLRLVFV